MISYKTPKFWSSNNIFSWVLLPFSYIYYFGFWARKVCSKAVKMPIPGICIGNLTAGGAGKTPVALYIGELLKSKGIKAFYISRGYGGSQKSPILVDLGEHNAKLVGDEPLLLAQILPTIVGKNRLQSAQFAVKNGAEIIIMDDGFQNPTLHKDLSLIVVDRHLSFGNERMLPAGPLRESVRSGLARADALILVNPATFLPTALPDIPIFLARTHPKNSMLALKGKKIIAFCGIAHPDKFYTMLAGVGAKIVEKNSFSDHHNYTNLELENLRGATKKQDAILVTTSKDAARIPAQFMDKITIAEMELVFENKQKLEELIDALLKKH